MTTAVDPVRWFEVQEIHDSLAGRIRGFLGRTVFRAVVDEIMCEFSITCKMQNRGND